MKNRLNSIRTAFYALSIAATGLALPSCSNSSKPEDSKEVAEEHNDAKFDEKKQEKDAQFLVEAAEINLEEIQLGQLAQTKSKNASVIALGKMMEDAHTKAMNDLKSLAEKKSITIPVALTEDGQDAYKKLSEKSEKDFNKDYCDMMVKGHEKAIDKFEKASTDCEDTDIKNWAGSMLPALREHLDHAKTCDDKMKKM